MTRNTTHIFHFYLPIPRENITQFNINFLQYNKIILSKSLEDFTYNAEDESYNIQLTPEETGRFQSVNRRCKPEDNLIYIQAILYDAEGRIVATMDEQIRLYDVLGT